MGFSKFIKDLFKSPNKSKEDVCEQTRKSYENLSPKQNETPLCKSDIDYNTSYKERPLPDVPSIASTSKSIMNDLPKPPKTLNFTVSATTVKSRRKSFTNAEEFIDGTTQYREPTEGNISPDS